MTTRPRLHRKPTSVVATAGLAVLIAAGSVASPALAAAQPSPYTEHTEREIKALSPEQVDQLLTGQGMGLALAGELNGYPGPKHVLELAGELELTGEQRGAVVEVFDAMHRAATGLGFEIVEAERRLDALFGRAEATPDALQAALDRLAALRADLRYAHLAAHLETRALLTETQRRRYEELRGYGAEGMDHPPGHHGHHPGRE